MTQQRTTRLFLIRHAESQANASGILQGSGGDAPLSPLGEQQAQRLAEWFRDEGPPIDALYSSPLRRAQQTAYAISAVLKRDVLIRDRLREVDLGGREGMSEADLRAEMASGAYQPIEGVGSPREFIEHSVGALHGLLAIHEGQTLVVVAHGGVISVALAHWIERDARRWVDFAATRNAAVSELMFGSCVELVRYNDTRHLDE